MLYIFSSTKVGDHDMVDKIESEHISCEFYTFMIMLSHAVDTEWSIAYADSFTTFQDIFWVSVLYFDTFEHCFSSGFSSYYGSHLPIIEYHAISHLHHSDDLRKTDLEMIIGAESFT